MPNLQMNYQKLFKKNNELSSYSLSFFSPKFADVCIYVGIQRNSNRLQSFSKLKYTYTCCLIRSYTYIYVYIL